MKLNPGLEFFVLFIAIMITPFLGFGQQNNHLKKEKSKKIELISPLDLTFKMDAAPKTDIMTQRSIFDAESLPLFCKIEHKLSKSPNLNIRMRLGSLDYVNKLEGKN